MGISIVKTANLALSFLLELCLLAAFAYWGIHTGETSTSKALLGAGAPLLTAIFWGIFMAPRASMRVGNPLYLIFKVVLFGLAVFALSAAGRSTLAWALGVLFLINTLIDFF
jgi:hypothetical protein